MFKSFILKLATDTISTEKKTLCIQIGQVTVFRRLKFGHNQSLKLKASLQELKKLEVRRRRFCNDQQVRNVTRNFIESLDL
jgi:hypothetical protein